MPSSSSTGPLVPGHVAFLPWVALPSPVRVGGFAFEPIDTETAGPSLDSAIDETLRSLLRRFVDMHGRPIQKFTLILRLRQQRRWNIPERLWPRAQVATNMLALAALAEQRFFEQLAPSLNATIFRPIAQGIALGSDRITLVVPRRDGQLLAGGWRFQDVSFQQPLAAYETTCPPISASFLKALDRSRIASSPAWRAVETSLPLFLLGHAESPDLPVHACAMLSAIAFERLLGADGSAQNVSRMFADHWRPFSQVVLKDSKRVRPDPKYASEQSGWPVHRKWMKELYETRSSLVHSGPVPDFSQNWSPAKHVVVSAFVFPLLVKVLLQREGVYEMDDDEVGDCEALDALLNSDWSRGRSIQSQWSLTLREHRASRHISDAVRQALSRTPVDRA